VGELVAQKAPIPATSAEDPRVGHLIGQGLGPGARPAAVIVGFPTDVGVRRNGGRPGAAEGPAAIRRHLYRLTPDAAAPEAMSAILRRTIDAGDLATSADLEADQAAFAAHLTPWLAGGTFVIVLGGGHETAYGHFLGHVGANQAVDVLNLDAHADVRETTGGLGHSGSPFRQALDHPSGLCRRYRVAGIQPWSAARAHLDLVTARGGAWVPASELGPLKIAGLFAGLEGPAMVSFDVDAVEQGFAPGVSAPAVRGLSPSSWLHAAYLAGRTPAVASAGVAELAPPLDRDDATARLAAVTIFEILRGLGER